MGKILGIIGAVLAFIASFVTVASDSTESVSYFSLFGPSLFVVWGSAAAGLIGSLANIRSLTVWAGGAAVVQGIYTFFVLVSEDGISLGAAVFILAIGGVLMAIASRMSPETA
jgi:hypothetical protein